MPTKEDVKLLKWHYENVKQDTVLLTQFCGEMRLSLTDGFRSIIEKIEELERQLSEMNE